ncbi:MAG: DNA glycosylase [Methanomassiliicoccales archaeon]|jgi:N-glycosylase/DNA lyase
MIFGGLSLDRTLGCGQVFRWKKERGWWKGVLANRLVKLRQKGTRIEVVGGIPENFLISYFRADDDLDGIVREISKDDYMVELVKRFDGLRLIRQDPWECAASYTLATYASIPRIEGMIENLCRTFGHEISDGLYSFPKPDEILENEERAIHCNLGFRCRRFVEFARRVHDADLDFERLRRVGYEECVNTLKRFEGVGDKVADCITLFSLDHVEAFPIDVRIKRAMEKAYGVKGSYKKVSEYGRAYFGKYAGYAQEYIYVSEARTQKYY